MQRKIQTVDTLLDALPFIKTFSGETVVIKYGGSAHGGGKSITALSEALGIQAVFKDGQRITDKETMRVAEMVLSGEINSEIVSLLNHAGAKAIGISGKDALAIRARPKAGGSFGYTGEITHVSADVLFKLIQDRFIPVIAPIAAGDEPGHPGYNINADVAACHIAVAVGAKKVIFLTDTPGVLDKEKQLLHSLTETQIEALKADGTISGGMIPKVDACLDSLKGGVDKAHIIDGRIEHALLLELFTSEGIGTEIIHDR